MGHPDFRVGGRIFATLPSSTLLRVMADPETIAAAVEDSPQTCSEVFWGKRLSAVGVRLVAAEAEQVEELLHAAWSRRAPARLLDPRRST